VRVSNRLRLLTEQPLISLSASQICKSRPIPGWILDALVVCDAAYPGVLRRFLSGSTSTLRKHGMALVVSRLDPEHPGYLADHLRPLGERHKFEGSSPLEFVSHVMLHRRVRDLVRTLYPEAVGLVGALIKFSETLSRSDYRALVELHSLPEHRTRRAVLYHLPSIPESAIQICRVLPAPYVRLPLLTRLRSVEQASDFVRAIELIKRVNPGVTDEVLASSLEALKSKTPLRGWVTRWLDKATEFWSPVPDVNESEMVVLQSAAAMRDVAKRFENCLEGQITQCALGRVLYVEYLPIPCIIQLESLSDGWVFESVHGVKNTSVDPATTRIVLEKLHACGVQIPARHWQAVRFNRVARLARILDPFRDNADLIDDEFSDPDQRISHAA
jgi:hypothetical protein